MFTYRARVWQVNPAGEFGGPNGEAWERPEREEPQCLKTLDAQRAPAVRAVWSFSFSNEETMLLR